MKENVMGNKYGAKKVEIDGITFDSRAEARRYSELMLLARSGQIARLECHPTYELAPAVRLGGRKKPALRYRPDFRYIDAAGNLVVEDVKGAKSTEAHRIRAHLMAHVHGIEVIEVRK